MMSEDEARAVWRTADAVCFDVDSTVIQEEGIDELAKFLGKADDVLHITRQAMCGGLPYRDALKQRLLMLSPSQHQVADFKRQQALRLSKGVSELVELLQHRGVPVFLISGGFRCLILPVAETLGVCPDHVIANRLLFDYDGNYWGFDQSQPTSASGGKPSVIQRLIDRHKFRRVVMIGDGATDAEAAPPASLFIGYGGNVVREKVRQMSPWFVHHFQELTDELRS